MSDSWHRAYNEYLRGRNGYGDPLSFAEFRDRLDIHGKLRPDSDPKTTKPRTPTVRELEPHASDGGDDYDLNAEGATGALVPANSKKKGPFAHPYYQVSNVRLGRNQGKAEREGVYRPGNVGKIEGYRAAGHTKIAGKHVSADGLVSRRGYRRVVPEALLRDNMERDYQIDELKRLAELALRGRNRSIFIRNVVEPLEGLPGVTYRELADQYGISITKIHRIIGDCHMRIAQALECERRAAVVADGCPTCGFRIKDCANDLPCDRGYRGGNLLEESRRFIHPECRWRFRFFTEEDQRLAREQLEKFVRD
jgi:hypothetical protein